MAKALVDKNTGVIYDVERPWLGGNIYGGDSRCLDTGVFQYLLDKYSPKTLVDVGCGEGQLMDWFYKNGVIVNGIDGLDDNIQNAVDTVKDRILLHDYIYGVQPVIKADMVVSCEFVEHVHKIFMCNYLPQFMSCNTLVFTHAVPNQHGHHHVNCESDSYWINLITSLGMRYAEKETEELRGVVNGSFWGTALIFRRIFA